MPMGTSTGVVNNGDTREIAHNEMPTSLRVAVEVDSTGTGFTIGKKTVTQSPAGPFVIAFAIAQHESLVLDNARGSDPVEYRIVHLSTQAP